VAAVRMRGYSDHLLDFKLNSFAPKSKLLFLPLLAILPLILGPTLFIMYTQDLTRIIERHGQLPHSMTTRTLFTPWNGRPCSACTDEILNWTWSNRLQLNAEKTELI